MHEAENTQALADLELHPEVWQRGDKRYVMLPYEEFMVLQEALEDVRDLRILRAAREEDHDEPGVPLADVMRELGLSS
ncbi:MAG: type II toxin-antitoxin system Phd/YefM family antitoxin [Chloroflexi bacterium]|nr:type II toxin-antitoxin system Phd/YefM family antitoxin [Chloroflexota bacterium]